MMQYADVASPDWRRFISDGDHRWHMGMRRGDTTTFFAPRDTSGTVLAERVHWLAHDEHCYAALTVEAEPALIDTVALAQSLGHRIDVARTLGEQMLALGGMWEADFVWMRAGVDGSHRLTGGVVCFPSSWALRDKLGRTMSETHGPVPGLNAALDASIETFFKRMDPGVAWVRENVNYSRSAELNQHPSRPRPRLDETISVDQVWIRLEHQLLLKLPTSRDILFAIRVEAIPLQKVIDAPWAATRLMRTLETMPTAVAEYKGLAHQGNTTARDLIVSFLRSGLPAHEQPPTVAQSTMMVADRAGRDLNNAS